MRVRAVLWFFIFMGGIAGLSAGCEAGPEDARAEAPTRFKASPALVAHIARDVLREMGAMDLELKADERRSRVRGDPVQGREVTVRVRHAGDGVSAVRVQTGMFGAPEIRRAVLQRLGERLPVVQDAA
jgi:hypothetical protein